MSSTRVIEKVDQARLEVVHEAKPRTAERERFVTAPPCRSLRERPSSGTRAHRRRLSFSPGFQRGRSGALLPGGACPLYRYTFDDYLRLEEESSTRHEFLEGEIVAMAGGTPEYAALAMAIGRQMGNQLEGHGCRVFSSDLRVKVSQTGLVTLSGRDGPVRAQPA